MIQPGASTERATGSTVPSWMAHTLTACLALVAGFGLVGLSLAVAGVFYSALVVPLGAVAAVALFRAAHLRGRGSVDGAPVDRPTATCAIGAALVACASVIINIAHAGQHVLIDRDPGAYLNTGRWLATHHRLEFAAKVGAFKAVNGLKYSSPAIYGRGSKMHFQFSHLLGVLLAEARWVGGDHAMFVLTPIIGGVAIVAFYALACRFVSPVAALVATVALATNVAQAHFSRDPYAEIVVELVLFGCVWLLTLSDLGVHRAIFAGVLLGTTVAARLDGPLYLASVPIVVGITAARRRRDHVGDDIQRDAVTALAIAAAAITVLAVLDVHLRVPEYATEVGARVLAEYVGLAVATAVAIVLGRAARYWHPPFARRTSTLKLACSALAVALLAMWLVRPHLQTMRGRAVTLVGQIQRTDHLAFDPGRHYYESSLRWIAWYIGPPTLVAGIAGVAWLLYRTVRHGSIAQWVVITSFGSVGAIYLWNASITPDQLWVMRRFVPIVIPGFLLGAVLVIDAIARRFRRPGYVAAAVLAALTIGWPIAADLPVWAETTQPQALNTLHTACRALGPKAAVIVIRGPDSFHLEVPQALRGFCGVPVAMLRLGFTPDDVVALARRWRADGRVLSVVADEPGQITGLLPHAHPRVVATSRNDHLLEQTLNRPPRHYATQTFTFLVATVPLSGP